MKIRFLIVLIMAVIGEGRLFAYMADEKQCRNAYAYLQTGAFSHEESLLSMQRRLRAFPLCMEREGRLFRLSVALPHAKGTRRWYIKKVKRIVPDAFMKRSVTPYAGSERHYQAEREGNEPLDARAILKTRKKFF